MPNQDADPTKVFLVAGELYYDRFDAGGASQGEMMLGTVEDVNISVEEETTARIYSSVDKARLLLSEIGLRRAGKVTWKFREYRRRNLELALGGTEGALTQGSGTLLDVAISAVKQDRWYPVREAGVHRRNITVTAVTGAAGTPTYVLNTDYKVDSISGRIYIIPGGGIADATNIEVDGSYAADTDKYVAVGDVGIINGSMRFIADPHVGPAYEVEIWKTVLRLGSVVSLLQQTEHGSFDVEAAILADTTKPSAERFIRMIER